MCKNLMLLCSAIILIVMLTIPSCGYAIETELYPGKTVKLLDMSHVTKKQYQNAQNKYQTFDYGLQSSVDLGMSSVPVLDQGQYGTCVTFSTTAAINARFSLGDFISQQCSLQLIKILGNDIWDGAYRPDEVIEPLKKYGVVSKSECNAQYPSRNVSISVDEYKKRIDKSVSASVSGLKYTYYSQNSLSALKSAVSSGKRVLIAFLVNPNKALGYDLPGKHGGSWRCSNLDVGPSPDPTPSPLEQCKLDWPGFEEWCEWIYGSDMKDNAAGNECQKWNAGHEVVVYGYDDARQILKIRNSWGPNVGDAGNWEMSYEYYNKQVMDQTVVQ